MRANRRAVVEVAAGVGLAILLTSVWDLVTIRILPRDGSSRPIVISLALSLVMQVLCVALLWMYRRRLAYGFLGYVGLELLFIVGALTVFHRS